MNTDIMRIAAHYGYKAQAVQTMEECAELIQALSKLTKVHTSNDIIKALPNIKEEIVDVEIMFMQLKYLLGIHNDELQEIEKQKIARQIERIDKERLNIVVINAATT